MSTELLIAQQAVSAALLAWWKVLLMLPAFVGWAWLVSTVLDKDARYYHLNHIMWNSLHLGAGFAALAATVLIPIFWLGWPLGILILLAPILAYWHVRDKGMPDAQKFKLTGEGLTAKLTARRQARAAQQAVIQLIDSKNQTRKIPLRDEPMYEMHMIAEDILGPAIDARASRIEVAVGNSGGAVRQTIDGIQYKLQTIPTDGALRMMDYLKEAAGLDVADRRRRQHGDFKIKGPQGEHEVHLVTAGSSSGQSLRIDLDQSKRLHKPFDGLGLLGPQVEALRALEQPHERHGLILIGAPQGQGLTTTAYSFLSRHDAYTSNVKTLEREVQVQLLGVDQTQWDPTNPDIDYATNLQSILRRDPDIVLTAEIVDRETARVVIEPGLKGPLMYIQQSLASIEDQLRDWARKVGDAKDAFRSLRAVTNQRLLRSLCPNCRQAYQPTADQIKKLNIPAKSVTQFYRASGKVQVKNKIENCPVCGGTGYLGQTGAFQVMIVDDEARKLLIAQDLKGALAHARRNKMFFIQEAALSKVVSGETDIDEVVRVTSAPRPAPSSSGAQAEAQTAKASKGGPASPAKPTAVS